MLLSTRQSLENITRQIEALPGDGWRLVAKNVGFTADQLRAWLGDPPEEVTLNFIHRVALALYFTMHQCDDATSQEESDEFRAWLAKLLVS